VESQPAGRPAARAEGRLWRFLRERSLLLKRAESVDELLGQAASAALALTGAERAIVLIRDEGGMLDERARVWRAGAEPGAGGDRPLSRTAVSRALEERRPVLLTDVSAAEDFRAVESVSAMELMTILAFPLLAPQIEGGGAPPGTPPVLGVLYLDSRAASGHLEAPELELLQILGTQTATMLVNLTLRNRLDRELEGYRREVRARWGALLGASPAMQEVFAVAERVAAVDLSVLITGETGTGKDTLAREIHEHSPRRGAPFVYLNVSSIPGNLLEAELFGIESGVATGVDARPGLLRQAAGGTIYLDEIAELRSEVQAKLLRFLQELEVLPVGGAAPIPVDVRVISSTSADLEARIADGAFREDLYYRLAGIRIDLPPLRRRLEDVLPLARSFIAAHARRYGRAAPELAPDAANALLRHGWPGNVRELENGIRRAVIFARGERITAADLQLDEGAAGASDSPGEGDGLGAVEGATLAAALERFDRAQIHAALSRTRGRVNRAAELLGISRMALHRVLRKYSIDYRAYRAGEGEDG
jgi:DNA-binding NtrC family response regulator